MKYVRTGVVVLVFLLTAVFPVICRAAEDDVIRIGISTSEDASDVTFQVLHKNLMLLGELAGIEYVDVEGISLGDTVDEVVYYVETLIENGADGILICPPSDQVLPIVCRVCEEAGVYWGIHFRSIRDERIREQCEASPYYIGNTFEDEEGSAYELTRKALQMGYRNFALISEAKWDTTCESREEGIYRAMEDYPDARILAEARSIQSEEDARDTVENFLDAYPELDCIYLVGSKIRQAPEVISDTIAREDQEGNVGLVTIDFSDSLSEDFQSGSLKAACGLPQLSIDIYYSVIKMLNMLKGYPLEETATSHSIDGILIESAEEAAAMSPIIENRELLFFSEDYIENTLFKWNNPALDGESFQQIIDENCYLTR